MVKTTAGRIPALSLTPGLPEAGDSPSAKEPLVVLLEGAGGLRAGIQSDPALDRAVGEAEVIVPDYVGDEVDEHVQVPLAGTGGLPIGPAST